MRKSRPEKRASRLLLAEKAAEQAAARLKEQADLDSASNAIGKAVSAATRARITANEEQKYLGKLNRATGRACCPPECRGPVSTFCASGSGCLHLEHARRDQREVLRAAIKAQEWAESVVLLREQQCARLRAKLKGTEAQAKVAELREKHFVKPSAERLSLRPAWVGNKLAGEEAIDWSELRFKKEA